MSHRRRPYAFALAASNEPSVLGRLETNPPAGPCGAPERRQKSVLRDPDALKKLST